MSSRLSPIAFVEQWRASQLKERSGYQEHFIGLCHLVDHPTPAEADPSGTSYAFEAGATKQSGGNGWADVWKRGAFAWEYKGKHANLDKAYNQILQYREALENPPLLVVCDFDTIVIHTNFTNTVKRVHRIALNDLVVPANLDRLRAIFEAPEQFRAPQTTQQVTEEAAREFAKLADLLRKWGEDPHQSARFLIRLLFVLFAEDIGLLPKGLFTRLLEQVRSEPKMFARQLRALFAEMAVGGYFGADPILRFNGGLFNDDTVLELPSDGLAILARVAALDWSSIEPAIFGTLFERSLDPRKRAQLGTHYTSRDDILLIVEPVLMKPLRCRWAEVRAQADALVERRAASPERQRSTLSRELVELLTGFSEELAQVRVLDPAAGSGNFLYVALKQLLDLEKEVSIFAGQVGVGAFFPRVSPEQLHGIEVDAFAHELAQVTVWIGYIQWLHDNGFGAPAEPILKSLDTIKHMDAVLAFDAAGRLVEPVWPKADVIIGNPPFLGDKKMRQDLGDTYVAQLRTLYAGRVAGAADFVTYWFERALALVEKGDVQRAGLLATNSIRYGSNRRVLERIKEQGDIFMAWSDRAWTLEGAAVRVSMIGFDNGAEPHKQLNGRSVSQINADLTATTDVASATCLGENRDICFLGMMKAGPFDLDEAQARAMLRAPFNPNGRPNSDVVKRRLGGQDVVKRPRDAWIIDFGVDTPENDAALYELPFEYVRTYVKPLRDENRRDSMRRRWWIHGEPRRTLRAAVQGLKRCIVTPEVAKHRIFTWMPTSTIPDHTCHVIVRDDDYFFGVLHSRLHEKWSLAIGNHMGVGNDPRYNSSRTFETFPFPWTPGNEPRADLRVEGIAVAARHLVELRDNWLNPEGADEAELKKRTLTNLYNQRPAWLDMAHRKLDAAVLDAYGWPRDSSDEELLARLLELNAERAAKGEGGRPQRDARAAVASSD